MAYVLESRRPAVSRLVLEHLSITPGIVEDVFIVKNISSHSKEEIFSALHVIKNLVTSDFTFCVNLSRSREAELIIRCAVPRDAERVDVTNASFKFDDQCIKIYKLASVSALPADEDTYYSAKMRAFPAYTEGLSGLGYPVGYTDELEDMRAHTNPRMSSSTMKILGILEGPVVDVLKVNIKHALSPEDFLYVIRVVPRGCYMFAVDQDGAFYLKCTRETVFDMLAGGHFFVDNRYMIKFYRVQTVRNCRVLLDKAIRPIYSRVHRDDHWERVVSLQ